MCYFSVGSVYLLARPFYISQILTKIQITNFLNVETEIWLINPMYLLFSMILVHFQRGVCCMSVRSHKTAGTDVLALLKVACQVIEGHHKGL